VGDGDQVLVCPPTDPGFCDGAILECLSPVPVGDSCELAGDAQCVSQTCNTSVSPPLCSGLGANDPPDPCDQVLFGNLSQPQCTDSGRCVSNDDDVDFLTRGVADGFCDDQCLNGPDGFPFNAGACTGIRCVDLRPCDRSVFW
jgi:hypothetical protein